MSVDRCHRPSHRYSNVMEIIIAKTAGFCFGVKKAIDLAFSVQEKRVQEGIDLPVYTLGPLIHNHEVIHDLEEKGIYALDSVEEVPEESLVIIRAHGVGKKTYEALAKKKVTLQDATCPFVKKIHGIVEKAGQEGREVIILGDPAHPEVEGIRGWCLTEPWIYKTKEDVLRHLPEKDKEYTLVFQTTSNPSVCEGILACLKEMGIAMEVVPTICSATLLHQTEARELAGKVDCMFVIGARHSSNSNKLYQLCLKENPETYFVETETEIPQEVLMKIRQHQLERIGITAGASTPQKIIENVAFVLERGEHEDL